jgi:hypothetical protein
MLFHAEFMPGIPSADLGARRLSRATGAGVALDAATQAYDRTCAGACSGRCGAGGGTLFPDPGRAS